MRKTKAVKEAHIKKWEMSGLSQADYCRKNGIPSGSFRGWLAAWRKEQDVEKTPEPRFVEIKTDMILEEAAHASATAVIVFRLKTGNAIEIPVSAPSHVIELILSTCLA
ncbi:hypothetical protein [Persicobacter sp. CCB-QB2]|uniref:IS66 family insertion sequence element accessory protein TnpA n=1 Tax=Persicobacter sp. CCB-QB2 TaxID=1561025 RepID=UPI0006A94A0F|nr:hypothetical protein [Persicobacter sp. CCB-QB2]